MARKIFALVVMVVMLVTFARLLQRWAEYFLARGSWQYAMIVMLCVAFVGGIWYLDSRDE